MKYKDLYKYILYINKKKQLTNIYIIYLDYNKIIILLYMHISLIKNLFKIMNCSFTFNLFNK